MTDEIKIPEGFTAWPGGKRPVRADIKVNVIFRDGQTNPDDIIRADTLHWGWYSYNNGAYDIIGYREVTP